MIATCIYIQIAEHFTTQTVLWKHAFDGFLHHVGWTTLHQVLSRYEALSARVTRMEEILLLTHFLTCESHLVCIDNDHIIAAVYVWGVGRFVLTTKHAGNLGSKAPHNLCFGIYQIPFFLNRVTVGRDSFVT